MSPCRYSMEFQTNHGDKQMDKGNDTVVGAILEQLIEHGSGDMAVSQRLV